MEKKRVVQNVPINLSQCILPTEDELNETFPN